MTKFGEIIMSKIFDVVKALWDGRGTIFSVVLWLAHRASRNRIKIRSGTGS